MLRVRVSKVTSEYLIDNLKVQPEVWYEAYWADKSEGIAYVKLPTGERYCRLDCVCAHLDDNEQTEWEVSDVD